MLSILSIPEKGAIQSIGANNMTNLLNIKRRQRRMESRSILVSNRSFSRFLGKNNRGGARRPI
jgi:hypothetical protein